MGEEIVLIRIECVRDAYQLDFLNKDTGISNRCFIQKDAFFAFVTVAEKAAIEREEYK